LILKKRGSQGSTTTDNNGHHGLIELKVENPMFLVFANLAKSLPYRGGGTGGTKPTCQIPLSLAWKPWDSDPTPQMEF